MANNKVKIVCGFPANGGGGEVETVTGETDAVETATVETVTIVTFKVETVAVEISFRYSSFSVFLRGFVRSQAPIHRCWAPGA